MTLVVNPVATISYFGEAYIIIHSELAGDVPDCNGATIGKLVDCAQELFHRYRINGFWINSKFEVDARATAGTDAAVTASAMSRSAWRRKDAVSRPTTSETWMMKANEWIIEADSWMRAAIE